MQVSQWQKPYLLLLKILKVESELHKYSTVQALFFLRTLRHLMNKCVQATNNIAKGAKVLCPKVACKMHSFISWLMFTLFNGVVHIHIAFIMLITLNTLHDFIMLIFMKCWYIAQCSTREPCSSIFSGTTATSANSLQTYRRNSSSWVPTTTPSNSFSNPRRNPTGCWLRFGTPSSKSSSAGSWLKRPSMGKF